MDIGVDLIWGDDSESEVFAQLKAKIYLLSSDIL
jgi:hypothetical protein